MLPRALKKKKIKRAAQRPGHERRGAGQARQEQSCIRRADVQASGSWQLVRLLKRGLIKQIQVFVKTF